MIAATGDDKVNVVVSLLAKTEFAVKRVVARVNDPRNEWLFTDAWGVDVAVSTPRILAAMVEEAVSIGGLVQLLTLRQGQANLVEVTLPDDTPLAGKRAHSSTCRTTPRWWPSCAAAGSSCQRRTTRSRRATSCCSWPRPRWSTRSGPHSA